MIAPDEPGRAAASADGIGNGITGVGAGATGSSLDSRHHQMHPGLSAVEMARMAGFGSARRYRAGERMLETGTPIPGLWVLRSGRVRVTRRDGLGSVHLMVEQTPGHFIGEVGALSGKPSLVDVHAVDDVEVDLVPPDRLRALLVAEAELGERIMRSLILRRVTLIEGGTGPIIVGGAEDPRVVVLQGFLCRNVYPHSVIDAFTDPEAIRLLERMRTSKDDLPLVICPDGTVMVSPSEHQLAAHLGWLPDLDPAHVYDVAVVGAGPAGLATAVYAASEGLSVIVFDSRAPGGQAGASARIENYLGFPTGISGQALAGRAFVQAQKFGAHIAIPAQVRALHCSARQAELELADARRVTSRTVVIASGAAYRRPRIANLDRFDGRGIYYWASPVEARLCDGDDVVLVGGGNSAGQAAVYLSSCTRYVHLLVRRDGLDETMSRYLADRVLSIPNITLHARTEVAWLEDEAGSLSAIHATTPTGPVRLRARHLFLFIGAHPNTAWLDGCGVGTDDKGFVLTGESAPGGARHGATSLETSVHGIFAIGDVRSDSTKRVAAAVGEGAAVVSQIHCVLAQRRRHVRRGADGAAPRASSMASVDR